MGKNAIFINIENNVFFFQSNFVTFIIKKHVDFFFPRTTVNYLSFINLNTAFVGVKISIFISRYTFYLTFISTSRAIIQNCPRHVVNNITGRIVFRIKIHRVSITLYI